METWKHLRAILLLPGMAAVVIPATLLVFTDLDTFDLWQSSPANIIMPVLGLLFIGLGLVLMVATIRLFMTVGKGTLAPWNPPQHFVVQGIYRHVRNPMISGVFSILLGQTLVSASLPLFCWFMFFVIANAIYIPLVEEPGLLKQLGEEYEVYRRNVPRWIPRVKAWQPRPPVPTMTARKCMGPGNVAKTFTGDAVACQPIKESGNRSLSARPPGLPHHETHRALTARR